MFLFPLFGLALLFSIGYTFFRYRELWRCTKWPIGVYWVLQIALLANYFILGFGGNIYRNETVATVMSVVAGLYFMYILYSGFMCLAMDLVTKVIAKKKKNKVLNFLRKPTGGLLAIICITLLFGVAGIFGMKCSHFVNYEISVDKQTELTQLKLAVISDAHMGTGVTRSGITDIVNKINEQKVDAVLLVGDFFDNGTTESLKVHTVKELDRLQSKYGSFYVEGNHEVYLREDQSKYFKDANIRVLMDEVATIADGISIVGRKDLSDNPISTAEIMRQVDTKKPVILMEHQPRQLKDAADAGVDLEVSGHTHGGQFPFGSIGTSLANDMNYGIKQIGNYRAITTSGIGGWGVPIKLFYPSEIVLISINFTK